MSSPVTKAKKERKSTKAQRRDYPGKVISLFSYKGSNNLSRYWVHAVLFSPILTGSSLNTVTGAQTNSSCRCIVSGWLVGFFASLCPCCIFWPNTGGYDEKGPINLKSFVQAGADADLGPCPPLCKFTKLLALRAYFSMLTPWVHMWSVIIYQRYSSVVAENHSTTPFFPRAIWAKFTNGPQTTALSSANHCHHCALWIFPMTLLPPLLYEAEHCWQGGMVGSASGTYQPHTASTAPSPTKAQHNHTRDSGNCSTKLRGLLKVTQ